MGFRGFGSSHSYLIFVVFGRLTAVRTLGIQLKNLLKLKEEIPNEEEFIAIRDLVGWGKADIEAAIISLKQGLFTVCLRKNNDLVGLGRVIGDGGLYFYIQDIIVHPDLQGQGYGSAIMDKCMKYINGHVKHGAMVGLLSAKGKESFYEKWDFMKRPNEIYGNGMCLFIKAKITS